MKWKLWAIGIFIALIALLRRTAYATDAIAKEMPVSPPPPTPVRCEPPPPEPTPTPTPTPFPEPEPDLVCTVVDYVALTYTETLVENVQEFLDAMPECDWCSACGSYSRYTRFEAEKKGLSVGEITLVDTDQKRVKAWLLSGHRLNWFNADGKRYYIDNTRMHRQILRKDELMSYANEMYGIELERIGFKDVINPR